MLQAWQKLRDEEFNFCNKIVILNVTVNSWLGLRASEGVLTAEGGECEGAQDRGSLNLKRGQPNAR